MHMSLREKLQHHTGPDATWADDGTTASATWQANGQPRMLITLAGPLAADALVDAHLRARATGATLTLAHDGPASALARRTAERFGITLLDTRTLPDTPEAPVATPEVRTPTPGAPPEVRTPTPVATPEVPAPAVDGVVVAHDELPALAQLDDPMPWGDAAAVDAEPEPAHVPAHEMMHVPWVHEDEHHEELPAGRERRHFADRPTQNGSWGLPWPRPTAPMDGLSRADPKIWGNGERLAAVRHTLDQAGATSFGAVKPEGSAWLKRIGDGL